MTSETEQSIAPPEAAITPVTLEQGGPFTPEDDRRPHMPEPLPVRLVTIDDARLIAGAGLERQLDEFYVDLLGFERDSVDPPIAYRAENFQIIFDVMEPPVRRDDMRPLGIELLSLNEVERKLIAAEMEYVRQKGLNPGQESILLLDPGGNWIELTESPMEIR